MSDKEKVLVTIIIALLSGTISYRVGDIDDELLRLEKKIDKVIANYKDSKT